MTACPSEAQCAAMTLTPASSGARSSSGLPRASAPEWKRTAERGRGVDDNARRCGESRRSGEIAWGAGPAGAQHSQRAGAQRSDKEPGQSATDSLQLAGCTGVAGASASLLAAR